jgi:hypothetical protein
MPRTMRRWRTRRVVLELAAQLNHIEPQAVRALLEAPTHTPVASCTVQTSWPGAVQERRLKDHPFDGCQQRSRRRRLSLVLDDQNPCHAGVLRTGHAVTMILQRPTFVPSLLKPRRRIRHQQFRSAWPRLRNLQCGRRSVMARSLPHRSDRTVNDPGAAVENR